MHRSERARTRRAVPAIGVAGAALLGLAACGGGGEGSTLRRGVLATEHLALELTSGTWDAGDPEVVFRRTVPAELGPGWHFSSPQILHVEVPASDTRPETWHAICFPRVDHDNHIRLPGPVEGGSADMAELELACRSEFRVRVLGMRGGEECASELHHGDGSDGPQVVRLEFPALERTEHVYPELILHLASCNAPVIVSEVRLLRRRPEARVPSPNQPARYVPVGTDFRPAVGLLPGRTLSAALAETAAARLEVDVALPEHVADRRAGEVVITVEGEEGTARDAVEPRHAWTTASIPLADVGASATVRIELEGGDADRAAALVAAPRLVRRVASPRTVVLVTSDTHRADHVGCAPRGVGVRTPFLDALAARGTRYDAAAAATTITNPSHVSMMTGLPLRDTRIYGNLTPVSERAETLAERYQDAGWRTFALVSASHLAPDRSGLGQGFERVEAPIVRAQRDSSETLEDVKGWVDAADGQPVFLWIHVFDAHSPYTPPEEDTRRYYGDGDPYDESLPELPEEMQAHWDRRVRDGMWILSQYKGEVTYLDRLVGDALAHPRLGEAVVAVTSDHGESLGEHDVYYEHRTLYPGTLDVPLILAGPGVPEGRVVEEPVINLDLGRTLLDLAGLEDAPFPGRNLLDDDALADMGREPRFAIGMMGTSASIQHDGWFLVWHLRGHAWGNPYPGERFQMELYRPADDPRCERNLADAHPERAERMRDALLRWLADRQGGGLVGSRVQDAAAVAQVQALGYATTDGDEGDDEIADALRRWRERDE